MGLYENLKTTVTQALAVTMVDDSRRVPVPDGSPGPPPVLPGVGDVVGSLYRLVRLLGEGMFGKVYVAERLDVPEHRVALKLLPKSLYAGRNVERELVMLATVGHPNVVQLKDHGFAEDYVWLTMPVYEGETLAERLERAPLDLREAYEIFLPIARGLEALHQAGLRHQDIKPENIFLAIFGRRVHPILLDLGVAAERDASFCAGTALYASPEQLLAFTGVPGAVPLSEKMDTYCLASTLLMALVGPERFVGDGAKSRDELAGAHEQRATRPITDDALPQLSETSRSLFQDRFKSWLALEPEARPSMSELAEQLDVLLEPEREQKREEDARLERQKASLWRFRLIAAALLLGGLGAVAWGYSKRETLRLAGELDRARAKGAESFDQLDTCIASHAVSRSEALDCRRERIQERAEFQASLAALSESNGNGAAREMQTMQNRLLACEVSAEEKLKQAHAEQERCETERVTLQTERDEARTTADKRGNEAAALLGERDQCVADRASIAADRDQCRTSIDPYHTPTPTPKPPPRPPAEEPAPVPGGPPTSAPTTAAPPQPAPVEEAGG